MKCNTKPAALLAVCLILGACSQNTGVAAPAESTTTTSATEAEVTTTEATTYVTTAETTAEETKPAQIYIEKLTYSEADDADIFPDVDITSREIADPLDFGKKYGNFISRRVWWYFGFSAQYEWTQESNGFFKDAKRNRHYYLCVAHRRDDTFPFNTKDGVGAVPESNMLFTTPISYDEGRAYIIGKLYITEQCFDKLCETSPSSYCEKDGNLYFSGQEGGNAGWDESIIVDYEQNGDSITYNCKRLAWEGLEDQPFTITLKYTDGKWLLDDCTNVEGFADHFCADISEEYDDYMDYYKLYA